MTYDLNYMAATKDPAEIPLAFDNKVNEGAYKLSQRVITLLFKDNDSALTETLGTDILELVTGNVNEEDVLQNEFTLAADEVREAIQSNTDEDITPENEQLDSLEIQVTIDPANRSYVTLLITVTTVSGQAIDSIVPYNLNGE